MNNNKKAYETRKEIENIINSSKYLPKKTKQKLKSLLLNYAGALYSAGMEKIKMDYEKDLEKIHQWELKNPEHAETLKEECRKTHDSFLTLVWEIIQKEKSLKGMVN